MAILTHTTDFTVKMTKCHQYVHPQDPEYARERVVRYPHSTGSKLPTGAAPHLTQRGSRLQGPGLSRTCPKLSKTGPKYSKMSHNSVK